MQQKTTVVSLLNKELGRLHESLRKSRRNQKWTKARIEAIEVKLMEELLKSDALTTGVAA